MHEKLEKPFILTIYGASGDLAKLKIFPSLYALAAQERLPEDYLIIGYARSEKTIEEFRNDFAEHVKKACDMGKIPFPYSPAVIEVILSRLHYFSGDYEDVTDFKRYFDFLREVAIEGNIKLPQMHLMYFSVPPIVFQPILQNVALARSSRHDDIRIILEKPFGDDEESASKLFHFLSRYYRDDQVFLLDHFLGKAAVRSILSLRHNNAVLNMLLKGKEIASIQITAHEEVGVEERAGYFDLVGIIKDMFQSHLTQILAMMTMSIPINADAYSFHREKQAILSALDFSPRPENIFLGQYSGYRHIKGVAPHSNTETYFAVKLKIDRESWYGVPIFVRVGKKLKKKLTTVVVEFKRLPFQKSHITPNRLIFEFHPGEMIHLKLLNQFGVASEYHEIATRESIACRGDDCLPEHAMLLADVFRNEKLNFLSFPEIIAGWRITDKLLRFVREKKLPVHPYEAGVEAPAGIESIFREKGEYWYQL